MADCAREAEDITSLSSSLNINFGILNDDKFKAIEISTRTANKLAIPIVFDPVGIGASDYRQQSAKYLLKKVDFSVIKGNISEIKTLFSDKVEHKGVDASELISEDSLVALSRFAIACANKSSSIIVISGKYDIVANAKKAYVVKNGTKELSHITGSGCMLSALISAFISAENNVETVLKAIMTMGIAGEFAVVKMKKQQAGNASFRTFLIDEIYNMTDDKLIKYGKYTEYTGGKNGE